MLPCVTWPEKANCTCTHLLSTHRNVPKSPFYQDGGQNYSFYTILWVVTVSCMTDFKLDFGLGMDGACNVFGKKLSKCILEDSSCTLEYPLFNCKKRKALIAFLKLLQTRHMFIVAKFKNIDKEKRTDSFHSEITTFDTLFHSLIYIRYVYSSF